MKLLNSLIILFTIALVQPAYSMDVERHLSSDEMDFLNNSDSMTLYGISPNPGGGSQSISGYPIVKSVNLKTPEARRNLASTLQRAIENGTYIAKCFQPHHAIKATRAGQTHEFVICFECQQVFETGSTVSKKFVISDGSRPEFDAILAGNGER